jgi:hypothetical protein
LDARRINIINTSEGIIWICAARFFLAQLIVQSLWTTPFSWATRLADCIQPIPVHIFARRGII